MREEIFEVFIYNMSCLDYFLIVFAVSMPYIKINNSILGKFFPGHKINRQRISSICDDLSNITYCCH